MKKITKICKDKAMHAQVKDDDHAIKDAIDAIEMAMELVKTLIIAEILSKGNAIEWKSACDKIMDRLQETWR